MRHYYVGNHWYRVDHWRSTPWLMPTIMGYSLGGDSIDFRIDNVPYSLTDSYLTVEPSR